MGFFWNFCKKKKRYEIFDCARSYYKITRVDLIGRGRSVEDKRGGEKEDR